MAASKIPKLTLSEDIQDSTLAWKSSICFRKFRKKHSILSRIQWTSELGVFYMGVENSKITPAEKLATTVSGLGFNGAMLSLNQAEMASWLPEYTDEIRNSILVLCSGNIELYLKRSIYIYLLSKGYASAGSKFNLNTIGKAIGAPVLKRSTIPDQLKYIESLLGISFSKHISVWENAYKERCTLAHQAGSISNSGGEDKSLYNEDVKTDWPSLLQVLNSTNQIAATIDQTIATGTARQIELKLELSLLKEAKKLPLKTDLWDYVHNALGCASPPRAQKEEIEDELY